GIGHLHISELSTLVEHPELVSEARAGGLTVSLDCGWDEELFTPEAGPLIAEVDVFLPNEAEANALQMAGLTLPIAPVTVIKRAALGAEAWSDDDHYTVPAQPVTVVDATGAGDAFDGGFLHAWLAGDNVRECLMAGNRSGAVAVSAPGGVGGIGRSVGEAASL
ncbi:MAG: PfkB family carbohydrate kinase, partial [Alphaproteobacteria bacterium]